jgi:hypothetical protein
MALVKGTNSFVTRDEANTYFSDRIDISAWTSATDSQKDQSLVTATRMLNNMRWVGTAISEGQALAFPRTGTYYDPKLGYAATLPETVPDRINEATYELAYHLLNNDGLLDDTGSVENLSVGQINLTIKSEASRIPFVVKAIISPLLERTSSRGWWRAN